MPRGGFFGGGPSVTVRVVQAKGLFNPAVHFKKKTKFHAYTIVRVAEGKPPKSKVLSERKTGTSTAVEKTKSAEELQFVRAGTVPPWDAKTGTVQLPLPVVVDGDAAHNPDVLPARANLSLAVEVWQKVPKEYYESNKDQVVGRCTIAVADLVHNDTPYDFWYDLGNGAGVRLHIVRSGASWANVPAPAPAPGTTPAAPPTAGSADPAGPAAAAAAKAPEPKKSTQQQQQQQQQVPAATPVGGTAVGGSSAFPALAALGGGDVAAAAPAPSAGAPPPASAPAVPAYAQPPPVPAYAQPPPPAASAPGGEVQAPTSLSYPDLTAPLFDLPTTAPHDIPKDYVSSSGHSHSGGGAPPAAAGAGGGGSAPAMAPVASAPVLGSSSGAGGSAGGAAAAPGVAHHPMHIAARLPDELAPRLVLVDVSACRLGDDSELVSYMSFCGVPDRWLRRGNHVALSFATPAGADAAALLDGGAVGGGSLKVIRYSDRAAAAEGRQHMLDTHVLRVPPARGDVEAVLGAFEAHAASASGAPAPVPAAGGSAAAAAGGQAATAPPPRPPKSGGAAAASAATADVPQSTGQRRVRFWNVGASADADAMTKFVAYCGPVASCALYKPVAGGEGAPQECLVEFERPDSAQTALLLRGAVVHGQGIEVAEADDAAVARLLDTAAFTPNGVVGATPAPPGGAAEAGGSATSVFASMRAAGYDVGTAAASRARAFDEGYAGGRFAAAGSKISAGAQSLNEQYHISEKANSVLTSAKSGFGFFGKKG